MSAIRIRSDTLGASVLMPIFALVWIAGTSGFAYLLFGRFPDQPLVYASLCCPAIGVVLVGMAILSVLRYARFGSTWLTMDAAPRVGGALEGVIDAKLELPPGAEVHFKLICTHRVSSRSPTGENRSISEMIWSGDAVTSADAIVRAGSRFSVPVHVVVPAHLTPSGPARGQPGRIDYRLEGKAEVPGVDFQVGFPIEVQAADALDRGPLDRDAS